MSNPTPGALRAADRLIPDFVEDRREVVECAAIVIDNETGVRELVGALESVQSAVWDAHYGNGLSVKYAQSVDSVVRAAITKAKSR